MKTIKALFERQIKQVTLQTVGANTSPHTVAESQSRVFDFQMSGGWV